MNCFLNIVKPMSLSCIVLCFSLAAHSQVIPDSLVHKKINAIPNPLQRLLTLDPHIYQYNTDRWKGIRLPTGRQYGFAPENVETAFPELVSYQNHSYIAGKNLFRTAKIKTVDMERLIPVLFGRFQRRIYCHVYGRDRWKKNLKVVVLTLNDILVIYQA